jgi:hypothetical protein
MLGVEEVVAATAAVVRAVALVGAADVLAAVEVDVVALF